MSGDPPARAAAGGSTAAGRGFRAPGPVVRLAPAKVNLTLAVLGIRPDGFHDLHSVMVPLDLADRLAVAPLPPGAPDALHVAGFDAGPVDDNLVLRAIAAARAAVGPGTAAVPVAARLEKRIPVAAGLAGGSSDAAAALDAALELWGAEIGEGERHRVAAALGSDVPFFLVGGAALAEGRGERLSRLRWPAAAPGAAPALLLVTPGLALATPAVFRAWGGGARAAGGAARLASAHLAEELRGGRLRPADLLVRAAVLAAANDLAPAAAAVEPALVPFRRGLVRLLGRPVGLSGSGPTHWALYPSLDAAETAAAHVRSALAAGELAAPGTRPAFVAAARIAPPTSATVAAGAPPADLDSRREP